MKFKISNRGFSIIGSLLGFSLLGLSTVGLATYMGSFEQVKVQYARQSSVNFMHSELLGSMEKIITMTETDVANPNNDNNKEYGLCKIVNNDNTYAPIKDKAICAIMLDGASIDNAVYYNARWTYFVEEGNNWEFSPGKCADVPTKKHGFVGEFTEGHFKKCVKYIGTSETEGIYARVSMEPQSIPDFQEITSSTGKIPVDELVYKFKSLISIPKELEPDEWVYSVSKGEKYLWSTEVLDCHICSGSDCKLARFSTASQGAAARHSRICYHSPYKAKEKKDSLEIIVEKISPEFAKSADRIVASTTTPDYSSSCRANFFRCGNTVEKKDFDPALKFRFLLNYDQPEDSFINQMDFKITDGTDNREYGTLFVSADQQARIGREKDGTDSTFSEQWPLRGGTNEITAFMADQKSGDSICTDICSASRPTYYPKLAVEYGGANCDSGNCSESLTASNRKIACYKCNMKSCHRYGVNTHMGKIDPLTNEYEPRADEPLDGSVPECLIEKPGSPFIADLTQVRGSGLKNLTYKCLQMGKGALEPVSCANTPDGGNPIFKTGTTKSACFSEGKTKVLEGGYTGGLDAKNNCLQVLQEEQLIGEKDAKGVWKEGVLPSLSTAYNIAPSTGDPNNPGVKDILEGIGGLPVVQTSSGDKKYVFNNYARFATFWGDYADPSLTSGTFVSVQRDASGMFNSGWVRYLGVANAGTTAERERWAFFYREPFSSINFHDAKRVGATTNPLTLPTGVTRKDFLGRARPTRPVYIKMDSNFHADYPGEKQSNSLSSNRLGLVHHLAFKGIRPISSPSTNDYPYLCKKGGTFVTTIAEGNVMTDGYAHCRNLGSGWHFIPPDSRKQWAAALQAVAPNSPRYPFPNPFNFADGIPFWKPKNDPKKRLWELSYNYEDLPAGDYLKSQETDHEFFFNKERGVLAQPATAWIGGLEPVASRGGIAGASWEWKPDWTRLLSSTFTVRNAPGGYPDSDQPSILFRDTYNAGQIDGVISQLSNDTDFTNIGALNWDGRKMTIRSLREPQSMALFKSKFTKLCRYTSGVFLGYHKALMILFRLNQRWPQGSTQDDCSTFTASQSEGSVGPAHYRGLPASPPGPSATGLANLTGQDFVEVRQGLRTLVPLLLYHTQRGIHVQNTDKLCRMWKREKKRRAVGNCIIKNYNDGTLSKGGVNHGLEVTRDSRVQAVCHPSGKNCANSPSFFQNQLSSKRAELSTAQSNLATAKSSLASARITCNQTCPTTCVTGTNTLFINCQRACWNCLNVAGCRGDADCESACRGGTNNCRTRCGCPQLGGCPTFTDCSARDNCNRAKNYACSSISGIETRIAALEARIIVLKDDVIPCMEANIGSITRTTCINDVGVDSHEQSYSPDFASCTEATALPIDFSKRGLPSSSQSRCWSIEDLAPKYQFTFNDGTSNVTGRVGVVGDTQSDHDWDKDHSCSTWPLFLHELPARCDDFYTDLSDLPAKFCDDDSIDYSNQTCEHNYSGNL